MTRRNVTAAQGSFLETLFLESETIQPPSELSAIPFTASQETEKSLEAGAKEMDDLFGIIALLKQTTLDVTPNNLPQEAPTPEITIPAQNENHLTPEWILDNCQEPLCKIVSTLNSLREFEGLPELEMGENVIALQLSQHLNDLQCYDSAAQVLQNWAHNLELFASRAYGSFQEQVSGETQSDVDALMKNLLHQPYDDEADWIHQALQIAVRKYLAGQAKSIYAALIATVIQRPVRNAVRRALEANQIPFPARVHAELREQEYEKTIRESLQTLARLGLTAQTLSLAWEAVHSGQSETGSPWIAKRADGSAAIIWRGYAVVESRVIRTLDYAVLALFDARKRVTRQITIEMNALNQAQQSLWAQGFRHGAEGFPIADRVVKLWCEVCRARDTGWWFCDDVGRVMVVIPYILKHRLAHHKPLCCAVAHMQAWGYRFCYDEHTLYFMPQGLSLPEGAQQNNNEYE